MTMRETVMGCCSWLSLICYSAHSHLRHPRPANVIFTVISLFTCLFSQCTMGQSRDPLVIVMGHGSHGLVFMNLCVVLAWPKFCNMWGITSRITSYLIYGSDTLNGSKVKVMTWLLFQINSIHHRILKTMFYLFPQKH